LGSPARTLPPSLRLPLNPGPSGTPNTLSPRPWDPTQWTAVDDRVRGGASQSHFSVSDNATGHFYGNLDITALGGAGFASQKFTFPSPEDLSGWAGMMINIAGGNEKKYTLVLKDGEELPKREDGRMQSTVSWEFDFVVKDGPVQYMPFGEFKATYRGRQVEAPERAFDPAGIRSVSVMLKR
jgi:hypothetical protein